MTMQIDRSGARILSWLAVSMLLVPGPAWSVAEGPVDGSERLTRLAPGATGGVAPVASVEHAMVCDVRLGPGGTLTGRVRDDRGVAMARTTVVLSRARQVVARAVTDDRGQYHIRGLAGGVYHVQVVTHEVIVRLWSSESAPPQARGQLDLDAKPRAGVEVRGQGGEVDEHKGLDPVHRFGLDGTGGLDALELTMLTTSIISLTLSAVMLTKIDELQDSIDLLPASD